MTHLHETLAAEKAIKSRVTRDLTELHRTSSNAAGYVGMSRTYTPRDEDGDPYPAEVQKVQQTALQAFRRLEELLTPLLDVTATKDTANQKAAADVVLDGVALLHAVPVPTLLFLEKQLNDIDTFVRKLPTLDPSVQWKWSEDAQHYVSNTVDSNRTQKVAVPVTLAQATDKHPAQVQLVNEDKVIGVYHAIKFSGAFSMKEHTVLLSRIAALKVAVKEARQRANLAQAEPVRVAGPIFDYLFAR